jgi:7-cyano-7-deazaguanine reductase
MSTDWEVLGKSVREPIEDLDVFQAPPEVTQVRLVCREFTSLCPVTGQPDFGTIEIVYAPRDLCIESKSLKLWLWRYRNMGSFCEALASEILSKIVDTIDPWTATVTVHQVPRGGIGIDATAAYAAEGSNWSETVIEEE